MSAEEHADEPLTKQAPVYQPNCSHCHSYKRRNGPLAFYEMIEYQISQNVRLSEVTTRPVKYNGLWCCMLLPIVLTACNLLHNVSPVYTLATFQSYALLVYSIFFLLFLYMTPAILTENRSTGFTVSTFISCILIYWNLPLSILHTVIFSTLAVYPYLFLLRKVLILCPNTFTIGEAMIVVQGIILFMNHIVSNWYFGHYEYNLSEDREMTFVKTTVATVLSTMGLIVTAMYLMRYKTVESAESAPQYFPVSLPVAGALFALLVLHYQLGKTYIADFIYLIFIDTVRLKLIGGWSMLVLLTVGIITRRANFGEKGSSGTRKPLHILASGVFLTGILADLKFLSLAAGIILALIVFLEAIRVNKLGSIAEGLQAAYDVYSDEKDSGVLAMTPIYLYVGLACPLLIVPWRPDCELELLSGVLSIGIGDSAASYFGEKFGTTKWPNSNRTKEGSTANVVAQVLVVYLLRSCGLILSPYSVTRTIFAGTVSALFESQLEQVDNLILPLIMVLCYELTYPITQLGDLKHVMDERNTSENESRWGSNATFRFVVLVSMLNEAAVVFAAAEISHGTYYAFALWHLVTVIFVGMPVVYSQLAITQYTNCDIISFWDYFPIFRGFGYGSIFIIFLKNIYLNVVTSWYLEYSFYAALDPPPWFSCDYFNTSKCMVKRVNVSVFQHCIEAENMYSDDCGMSTASYWLYEIEIGGNNTKDYPSSCFYPWRPLVGAVCLNVMIFVLSLKKERFFLVFAKLTVVYLCAVTLTLLVVSLTAPGGVRRAARGAGAGAADFTVERSARGLQRALLALGPGSALLVFVSRDAPFRAPAAMTAIATALGSALVCVLLALIVYTGLEVMVFFHGETDNIIEIGDSYIFLPFASVSEIMSYFNGQPIWGLLWYSMVFLCLLINLWLDYVFLFDVIKARLNVGGRYSTLCRFVVKVGIYFLSWPFYCIDLNGTLSDALSVLELTAAFFFSLSFYWIYGYKTHATDITFMIGIKPSIFWKTAWCLNPLILLFCLYSKWSTLDVVNFSDSYQPRNVDLPVDVILLLFLVSVYVVIVLCGLVYTLVHYHRKGDIRKAFMPTETWGPVDVILFKSRAMFVPKLMTREFLYRQVRIRGYKSRQQNSNTHDDEETGQVEPKVNAKRPKISKLSRSGGE